MLIYAIIYNIAQCVIMGVVFFQFGSVVLTGKSDKRLTAFGESLSIYIAQIINYLVYGSEEKPFPISNWPKLNEIEEPLLIESEPPRKEIEST